MKEGWTWLNCTPKGRLGGFDKHTQVVIQYTQRKPMMSGKEMKQYNRSSVKNQLDIQEIKNVTQEFQDKHLPDFKRPDQPTIWEKEDWWQWRLPADKLPQGGRGEFWDGYPDQITDYRKRYNFLMNPGGYSTKSRMKVGLHYDMDQRYDTSSKIPEPSMDITKIHSDIKKSKDYYQKSRDLYEKIQEYKKSEDKEQLHATQVQKEMHDAERTRFFSKMTPHRAKFVNWNAAIGRKEAELDRWRKDRNIRPSDFKAVKASYIGPMKAKALWAEKTMATLTREHKELMAQRAAAGKDRSKSKSNKMKKPVEGAANAKMKTLGTH